MASTYVPSLRGYIADVPQFFFKRADNRVFVNKHVTQCSLTPQIDFQEVRAGWSSYAAAYLPGQATMDVQLTLGQFDAEIFAMANAEDFKKEANFEHYLMEHHKPDATTHKVTLDNVPVAGSVYINGLEEATGNTPTAGSDAQKGTYVVNAETKEITFAEDVVEDLEISYKTVDEAQMVDITNNKVACGETVLKWPVYGDNKDCTENGIIKYVVVRIFKTRVTTLPGFDTSYKSPATFPLTLSTMDPERNDEVVWQMGIIDNVKN